MSTWAKIKYLTSEVKATLVDDIRYLLIFVAWSSTSLIMIIASSFMVLYINHYLETGVLQDDEEVTTLFTRIITVSFMTSIVVMFLVAKMLNKVSLKIIFPCVFIARALFCLELRFVKDPRSLYCQIAIGGMITISVAQWIMIYTMFYRSLPGHIRGIMVSIFHTSNSISAIPYVLVAGKLHDKIGHASPFTLVSAYDFTVLFLFLVLLCCGKLKNL